MVDPSRFKPLSEHIERILDGIIGCVVPWREDGEPKTRFEAGHVATEWKCALIRIMGKFVAYPGFGLRFQIIFAAKMNAVPATLSEIATGWVQDANLIHGRSFQAVTETIPPKAIDLCRQ